MKRLVVVLLTFVSLAAAFSLGDSTVIKPRVDYDLGVVFLERWRGDFFIGVEGVVALDEYIDHQLQESVARSWRIQAQQARERRELSSSAAGLIPDIELPELPVFGEGSRIDISGHDRITLGGRQTNVEVKGVARTPGQRTLPELKMEQQLAVRVNGSIGERTKVMIDHDSERQESKNKIKLSYEGSEDDILQSIELGDTRLSIPGTQYTGDLPAHKGLFGMSARGKLGGIDLYGIASREESQGQTQSFTGQRRVSIDTIYARSYVRNRFFTFPVDGNLLNLRVYVDDKVPSNNEVSIRGIATVYPDDPDSAPTHWTYDRAGGDFDLKTVGTDFVLHPGNIIEFSRRVDDNAVIGVVVFTDTDTLGSYYHNDSLVMQLLKPEEPDVRSLTWDYALRNVYALPQDEVQLSYVAIFRDNPGDEADIDYEEQDPGRRKFLELLGLDPDNDGRLEYPQFDRKTGLIRFPTLKPFDSPELAVRDSVLYTRYPLESGEGMKYYLVVKYSSATGSYYLGQVDIEKESEKVYVNGELWTRDVDYEINYSTGLLSFRRELPPDADIRVTFEYQPLFSLSQKSLVGTRAEWKFSGNGRVGTSVFYRSEGIPDDKPALGSEPFRRMIAEADASYNAQSNEISAFLDRLPLVRAQTPTTFSARVEGAVSLPDPNTRGVAYLDDFESTTITRELPTGAKLWSHASVPVGKDTVELTQAPLFWWSPWTDSLRVRKDSVFGPAIGDEGRETREFLRVVFEPDIGNRHSWAGIMHSPSQMGMNLKDILNLQLVLRSKHDHGTIHVSVGMSIDEDAPRRSRSGAIVGYNGRLDTEDRNGNGILDEGIEDSGLDTVFGIDDSLVAGDDWNDDYDVRDNQSGTENNGQLDSEDLDRNGFSRYNHYFECAIPLGENEFSDPLHGDWVLYRVSLDTTVFEEIGSPKWENIKAVRVWFDGFEETDTIDFYSIEFVGSKWREPTLQDIVEPTPPTSDTTSLWIPRSGPAPPDTSEEVWVTQVSKKTDPDYEPPFDPKRNVYGQVEQEASLLFGYRNLRGSRRAVVSRTMADRDDYREYRELRIYVHDDGNRMGFLFRIGADSFNYYEYFAPVTTGDPIAGRDRWYEFTIELDSLPGLKQRRNEQGSPDVVWTTGSFRLRGNPSLADVRYTALGIEHYGEGRVEGAIWFDDLRLSDPRKETGYGLQAQASLGISDIVNVGVSVGYSDPNFRRFSEGRGVKMGGFGTNVGMNVRASLDRFTPRGWGLNVPLSYGVSERRDVPKYSATHPDLLLDPETGQEQISRSREENISLDNVRKQRSNNRIMNYTVEAMGFSWRQRRGYSHAAMNDDSTSSRNFQWSYGVNPDLKIRLNEDNDLYFFPQSIRLGVSDGSMQSVRIARRSLGDTAQVDTTRTRSHGINTDFGVDYSPIEDLSFEYGVGTDRDALVPEDTLFRFLRVGSEAGRDENFGVSYSMDLWDILSPSADFDGEYSDERPKEGESRYAQYRNMNNSAEIDVGLSVELSEIVDRMEPEEPRRPDDSIPVRVSPLVTLRRGLTAVAGALDPIDVGFTTGQSSDLIRVLSPDSGGPAPWLYRLGFISTLDESIYERSSENREVTTSWRLSSGVRVKELRVGFAYDWTQSTNTNILTAVRDQSVSWPDLDYSLGRVHTLFSKYATDSKLTGRYRHRYDISGDWAHDSMAMYGRTVGQTHDLNPLVSWQTTWKRKITTTLSAKYSFTEGTTFLGDTAGNQTVTNSDSRGGNFKLSYVFSAPKGLRLPFLSRVRFSSDLRLSWLLDYSQSSRRRKTPDDPDFVFLQNDRSWSTRLEASYSFSRTIEAGSRVGYSYTKAQTGTETKTTDMDFWVLFRF